ncbi:MAG: RICIN domain-containing protein [Ruminococcus sp.]
MSVKKLMSFITAGIVILSGISFNTSKANAEIISRVSVHDPSIIKDPVSNQYYVFGSHIDAAKSSDLQNWRTFTNGYTTPNNVEFGDLSENLKKAFDWCGEDLEDCKGGFSVWAPDVIWNPEYINTDGSKGAYVMYFCTSSTYIRSVICYAVSKNIEGPYQFVDTLIYTGFTANDQYVSSDTKNVNKKYTSTNIDELIASGEVTYNSDWFIGNNYNNNAFPNAIDPTIYYDTDGKMYMVYGSWSGGIFTLEIDPKTGKCIHPKTGTTSDGRMVDSYFGTKLIGGYHKSGEGPFIEYNEDTGYYYLWVTFGGLFSEGGYNMRVYRSRNPLGPFEDPTGNNGIMNANSNLDSCGLKVMGNYKFTTNNTAYMACGHNSVLKDDDGNWYLFYHARFNDGTEFHQVRVHSMQFNSEGWPVTAPNEYQGDAIHKYGYDESDIAGTYEFINHGNDTGSKIYNSSEITLTSDGKISGAVSGTWSESSGSNDAVFTIGGQKYCGKFLAAKDEKGKMVMSFTAVGSNNQTIWGNKTTSFTGTPRENGYETASFTDGSVYTIKNASSNLYMEAAGNIAENNTNVQQWDLNGGDAESTDTPDKWNTWRLFDAGEGYYYIISQMADGAAYALDVSGKKADNGTNICIYEFNGGDNQKFKFAKNSDGSYKILTKVSNDKSAVEIENGSAEYGANVQEWEINGAECQNWILENAHNFGTEMDTNLIYTFSNANSGLVMDIENGNMAEGSNVQQWESNGFDCQKWKLVPYGDDNCYFIKSCMNESYGLCIEDNGNLSIKNFDKEDKSMLFKFAKNIDDTYSVMTCSSEGSKVLEVKNAGTNIGDNIQQWDMNGHSCQKWNIITSEIPNVKGDVNADGIFSIADAVLLQKWLAAVPDIKPADLKAADLCEDGKINISDLCVMKHELISTR